MDKVAVAQFAEGFIRVTGSRSEHQRFARKAANLSQGAAPIRFGDLANNYWDHRWSARERWCDGEQERKYDT